MGPSITVHYNGYVDTSMQGNSGSSVGPAINVRYNG
jgi:hypothetical protein